MKKLISLLTTIGVIAGSASSVVSCGSSVSFAGVDGQKVLVVSDSGPKNDKSFNQSSFEAMTEWADANKSDSSQDYTKNFIQPKSADASDIKQSLKQVERFKPNALVLSGGTFGDNDILSEASTSVADDGKILWVDGTEDQTKDYKNIIAISFKSELAGFEAGYAAVSEFIKIKGNESAESIKIGTYGGGTGNLPYAVTNYMWGLVLGAMYYGGTIGANEDSKLTSISVQTGIKSSITWSSESNIKASGDIDGFTGDFAQGSSGSTNYALSYKDNDINFVVAGPQVADLLTDISSDSNKYVIGVDVDQAAQYENYKSHFLFSAGKDIKSAVKSGLSQLDSLTQKDGNKGTGIDGQLLEKTEWSKLLTSKDNVVDNVSEYTAEKILSESDNAKADKISEQYKNAVEKGDKFISLDSIKNTLDELNK